MDDIITLAGSSAIGDSLLSGPGAGRPGEHARASVPRQAHVVLHTDGYDRLSVLFWRPTCDRLTVSFWRPTSLSIFKYACAGFHEEASAYQMAA